MTIENKKINNLEIASHTAAGWVSSKANSVREEQLKKIFFFFSTPSGSNVYIIHIWMDKLFITLSKHIVKKMLSEYTQIVMWGRPNTNVWVKRIMFIQNLTIVWFRWIFFSARSKHNYFAGVHLYAKKFVFDGRWWLRHLIHRKPFDTISTKSPVNCLLSKLIASIKVLKQNTSKWINILLDQVPGKIINQWKSTWTLVSKSNINKMNRKWIINKCVFFNDVSCGWTIISFTWN